MSEPTPEHLGEHFFWGVSTSGYQHEGGYNGDGQPSNNWRGWEKSHRASTTGKAADFWHKYPEDFSGAQAMGVNAFRLSVEWSRVQPVQPTLGDGRSVFDEDALDTYAEMIAEARRCGLEPFVTLHHFTHPEWLGADPWLDTRTPGIFATYVVGVVTALNRRLLAAQVPAIRWIITINEPNMLVLNTYQSNSFPSNKTRGNRRSVAAVETLLCAHVLAYRALHGLYARHAEWGVEPMVSFNNYASDLYYTDKVMLDLVASARMGVRPEAIREWTASRCAAFDSAFDRAMLPFERTLFFWLGKGVKVIHRWIGKWLVEPSRFTRLLPLLWQRPGEMPVDYLAFDYYDPFVAHALRPPRLSEVDWHRSPVREWIVQGCMSKWWDWRPLPEGLGFFCELYQRDFPGLFQVIAENGMAFRRRTNAELPWRRDSVTRSEFLRMHVGEVSKLRERGVPLIGYFYWSLTDNYEWGSFAPRFGLFHIDFSSEKLERVAVDALGDNPSKTYSELIVSEGKRAASEGWARKKSDFPSEKA